MNEASRKATVKTGQKGFILTRKICAFFPFLVDFFFLFCLPSFCKPVSRAPDRTTAPSSICFRRLTPDYRCLRSGPSWPYLLFLLLWFSLLHNTVCGNISAYSVVFHQRGTASLRGQNESLYSRTSMARTSLGPWKFVLDIIVDSSSH